MIVGNVTMAEEVIPPSKSMPDIPKPQLNQTVSETPVMQAPPVKFDKSEQPLPLNITEP